ncbi:MAG: AzlC family ABC transporter permease [Leuconostoc mesenteroides]
MKDSLPTVFGFLSIGDAFGIIAASEGFSAWQIFLLSAVLYAGSAQFIVF